MKKILFLGNSFTYFYDLPCQVEALGGGELVCHSITRGGAYLNAYMTESDELTVKLGEMLRDNEYDFVVLQEQSLNAVVNFHDYLGSVKHIKSLVGKAKTVIYQTWSYKDGSPLLDSTGLTFCEMTDSLEKAAKIAAGEIDADVVSVGRAFADSIAEHPEIQLYDEDCLHPSEAGSALAAKLFAEYFLDYIQE